MVFEAILSGVWLTSRRRVGGHGLHNLRLLHYFDVSKPFQEPRIRYRTRFPDSMTFWGRRELTHDHTALSWSNLQSYLSFYLSVANVRLYTCGAFVRSKNTRIYMVMRWTQGVRLQWLPCANIFQFFPIIWFTTFDRRIRVINAITHNSSDSQSTEFHCYFLTNHELFIYLFRLRFNQHFIWNSISFVPLGCIYREGKSGLAFEISNRGITGDSTLATACRYNA